jgi:hypothetical protein
MKRILFPLLSFLFLATATHAQSVKESDITNPETPIVYLGLDFTEARLLGDLGADENAIKNQHIPDINQLVVNEGKKFDFEKALHRSKISSDLGFSYARNKTIDASKIKSTNSDDFTRFKPETVQSIVSKYEFGDKKGLGLLFVVEALNKTKAEAAIWVTWIDMGSKKVLKTDRKIGKGGGFGWRNYWVHPVDDILDDLRKGK